MYIIIVCGFIHPLSKWYIINCQEKCMKHKSFSKPQRSMYRITISVKRFQTSFSSPCWNTGSDIVECGREKECSQLRSESLCCSSLFASRGMSSAIPMPWVTLIYSLFYKKEKKKGWWYPDCEAEEKQTNKQKSQNKIRELPL